MMKVHTVLERMNKVGMAMKLEKCKFARNEIEWLGYKITQSGITPVESKLDSIQKQKTPKTLKKIKIVDGGSTPAKQIQ